MDLLTAVVAIQDLKSAYQAMRSEDELNKLISNSRLFANETQSTLPASEIATPPQKRHRCLPTRFRSSVARGGGLEPPHWLVKYAKSHVFGAFEADFW